MIKYAKQFIKKYKLSKRGLSYKSLKNIFVSLGYKIIFFNSLSNTSDIQRVINLCKLQRDIENRRAFVYVNGTTKLLFMHAGIAEDERIHYMLHELGHIWLKHIYIETDEDVQEREADEFAVTVKLLLNRSNKRIVSILAICVIIVIILSAYLFRLPVKQVPSPTVPNQQTTSEISQSDSFYITKSGTKYHLPTCQYVKYKTNIIEISKEEALNGGYEPCKVCKP